VFIADEGIMTTSYGRILSIEEDLRIRERIVAHLEDSGFTVYEANNIQEGLDIFHSKKPDLVLSDLHIPSKSGLEILDILKKEAPETPVIIVSSSDEMNDVIEALRLGAWDYVVKPFSNMTVLEHSVCRALERGRLVIENRNYRLELEEENTQLSHSLAQLKEDQTAGKSVQQKLLPKPAFEFGDFAITHKVIPSLILSGDFVDYFEITKDKMGFYIADVSGHGASSAFVTVLLKSLISQILTKFQVDQDDRILHPDKVLKLVSDEILNAKLGKYLTMIYCVLDLKENKLSYSVGGHYPNPVLFDGNKAQFLKGGGFAVGIFKDAKFESHSCELPKAFSLVMFSDGIFEVMDGKNLEENEKMILKLVNKEDITIEDILKPLGIQSDEGFPDDITLLIMSRKIE
jgi:serine phosphatase RsbU (regulator of sigma subunit)